MLQKEKEKHCVLEIDTEPSKHSSSIVNEEFLICKALVDKRTGEILQDD